MNLFVFSLDIAGTEWFILIIMAIIIIFPSKISSITKTIGKFVGEYEKTKSKLLHEKNNLTGQSLTYDQEYKGPAISRPVTSEREKLEIIAKSLNIDSENKLDNELKNLISLRLKEDHQN